MKGKNTTKLCKEELMNAVEVYLRTEVLKNPDFKVTDIARRKDAFFEVKLEGGVQPRAVKAREPGVPDKLPGKKDA